jgi:hypothetical protein
MRVALFVRSNQKQHQKKMRKLLTRVSELIRQDDSSRVKPKPTLPILKCLLTPYTRAKAEQTTPTNSPSSTSTSLHPSKVEHRATCCTIEHDRMMHDVSRRRRVSLLRELGAFIARDWRSHKRIRMSAYQISPRDDGKDCVNIVVCRARSTVQASRVKSYKDDQQTKWFHSVGVSGGTPCSGPNWPCLLRKPCRAARMLNK